LPQKAHPYVGALLPVSYYSGVNGVAYKFRHLIEAEQHGVCVTQRFLPEHKHKSRMV